MFVSVSGMVNQGSWQLMIMEQRQAGHLARWDNSILMDPYMLVGSLCSLEIKFLILVFLTVFPSFVCMIFVFLTKRWHERDRSSHKQAVPGRTGGMRVPFHAFHWLSLSFGGGRSWWQEHQHLLQLNNLFPRGFIFHILSNWNCHPESDSPEPKQ